MVHSVSYWNLVSMYQTVLGLKEMRYILQQVCEERIYIVFTVAPQVPMRPAQQNASSTIRVLFFTLTIHFSIRGTWWGIGGHDLDLC